MRPLVLSAHRMVLWASPEKDTKRRVPVSVAETEMQAMDDQAVDTHEYELVFVLQPDLDEDGVRGFNERLSQVITSQSGTIATTELWGRRTLAYPINRFFEGQYVLLRFAMLPAGATEVDRLLRFSETVLRYLLIRTDD